MRKLLYPIIFEAEDPAKTTSLSDLKKLKTTNTFTAPEYALIELPDGKSLFLYHAGILKAQIQANKLNPMDWGAGMIALRDSGNTCLGALGALQVALVASGDRPAFKGAGSVMYALASKFYDAPLTSDRKHSSSTDARATWDKLTTSGGFKRVQPLDNFFDDKASGLKKYVDIDPDDRSSYLELPEPKTKTEIDDCPLPAYMGKADLATAVKYTGTADIWKYQGSIDPNPLLQRHKQVEQELAALGVDPGSLAKALTAGATVLFRARYKGVG